MRNKIILTTIILFSLVLRLWDIGKVPISPDWDEVTLGYNAFSILRTGKDEYGVSYPLVLRSFDDYKPALYTYVVIPFIQLLGLDIISVRLPSVLLGIVLIVASYFLVKELFKRDDIALLASFLFAISPWHLQFSRVAFEANLGLTLNIIAILFFLKSLKKPIYLLIASFFSALSFYAYQNEKVFIPLLIGALVIIYYQDLKKISRKYLILSITLFFVVILPMILFILNNQQALSRAKNTSIFTKQQILEKSIQRAAIDKENNDLIGLIFNNRRTVYGKEILAGYLSHFDLNWLFLTGDNPRHHAPNVGLLYLIELPFLLIGIYNILFNRISNNVSLQSKFFIFAWFLIAPIPASITYEVPHAVRTLNILPTFQIFVAAGIITFTTFVLGIRYRILNFPIKYAFIAVVILFFMLNFFYYLNQYFVQQNYFHARYWQYGYKELVEYIIGIHGNYEKVIVSNEFPLDQSYMFFLFYMRYDPSLYILENSANTKDINIKNFSNMEFRPINYLREDQNVLLVGREQDFPEDAKPLQIIYYPDGDVALEVFEKK